MTSWRPRRAETKVEGRSVPALGATVDEWRAMLSRLSMEQLKRRSPVDPRFTQTYHPVRLGLEPEHVDTLIQGGSITLNRHMLEKPHDRTGQLVFLPAEHRDRMLSMVANNKRSMKMRMGQEAVQYNQLHSGALFGGGIIGSIYKNVFQRVWGGTYGKCPKPFKRFLKEHGEEVITSIVLVRTPINSAISRVLNLISLGTFQARKERLRYPDLFHLAVLVNSYRLEKNHTVQERAARVDELKGIPASDIMHVPVDHDVSINQLISDGWREQTLITGDKDSFWTYSARKSNCQNFAWVCLKGSGFDTPAAKVLILQNAQELLSQIPGTELLTDLAGVASDLTQGLV